MHYDNLQPKAFTFLFWKRKRAILAILPEQCMQVTQEFHVFEFPAFVCVCVWGGGGGGLEKKKLSIK